MARTTIDVGIDLGTTNSSIAVMDGIEARIVPNRSTGAVITPSAVWIDRRGNVRVGEEAKARFATKQDAGDCSMEFKQFMGDGPESAVTFERSEKTLLPEELSAEVLKRLKDDYRTRLNEDLRAAVITVPAAFENSSTAATIRAAKLAGLDLSPLLLEPVAASLAYGFQSEEENVYWFVYDLGGGTFDAALMRISGGLIQVVDHNGDNVLGGKLIDWDIVTRLLAPHLEQQYNLPDFRRGRPDKKWDFALYRLKLIAEKAKIDACTSMQACNIYEEGIFEDDDGKPVDLDFDLTLEQIAEVSRPYIERSLSLCRKTLEEAGITASGLNRVLLVGGSTLNPFVREAVEKEFGRPVDSSIDPVTVVAQGAAIFAATQRLPRDPDAKPVEEGTWELQIEHEPVGNVADPDIGGRVLPPEGRSVEGMTVEFVDTKTQWRSGRVELSSDGVFFTQLLAERHGRHEYAIELFDATGSRIPTSPASVSYMIGYVPENPPAVASIGIGLATGAVARYVEKGTSIPSTGYRKTLDHVTAYPLRAGVAEDVISIPLLEGENPRANRNHMIGSLEISGKDIRRNLPVGSMVEVTLFMDQSQQIRLQAFVRDLDEDLDATFSPFAEIDSLDELISELTRQKQRLVELTRRADEAGATSAHKILSAIEEQSLVRTADETAKRAEGDLSAIKELDRQLRNFASRLDDVEDAVEWPALLKEAEEDRQHTQTIVDDYGTDADKEALSGINTSIERAIANTNPDILRRSLDDLLHLRLDVLERQPGFHVQRFKWLCESIDDMRDRDLAARIVAQGERAVTNNDLDGVKAANRQLMSLLKVEPTDPRRKDPRFGGLA